MTRVVVFGFGSGPIKVLKWLHERENIVSLVMPWNKIDEDLEPARSWAIDRKIPILWQGQDNKDGLTAAIKWFKPDVGVICSYTLRIPKDIIEIPPRGIVNIHGGKLPKYRGPHVLQWAIIQGDKRVGITLHYVDENFDSGDIIATTYVPIKNNDNAAKIYKRMAIVDAKLLARNWQDIVDGTTVRIKQDEKLAWYWPRRQEEDGLINWNKSAKDIHNLVRALVNPWPGAFSYIGPTKVIIDKSSIIDIELGNGRRGEIIWHDKVGVWVLAGSNVVRIEEITIKDKSYKGAKMKKLLLVGNKFEEAKNG